VSNLVRLGAALRPAPIEASLARVLALAANRPPDEDAGLLAADRQALEARATALRAALAPCAPRRVAELLLTLERMPARREVEAAEAKLAAAREIEDLRRYPEWALVEVIDRVRTGRAGLDHTFRPATIELCRLLDRCVAPVAAELARVERVLAPRSPQRAAEGAERRRAVAAEIRAQFGLTGEGRAATPHRQSPEEPKAAALPPTLEELTERFRAPITISTPSMARCRARMQAEWLAGEERSVNDCASR